MTDTEIINFLDSFDIVEISATSDAFESSLKPILFFGGLASQGGISIREAVANHLKDRAV